MADPSDGLLEVGIGQRMALARKAAWLSQREVAGRLGIPRRTYAYYESDAGDLPSSLLVPLADILGVAVHELLGIEEPGPRRPGPKGYMQERLEALKEMPRKDQRFVGKFLDQVLEDYGRRRRKGRDTEGES
jgi:transcriptional regulator with XRE-family HTH domain